MPVLIDVRKLRVINHLLSESALNVADAVTTMAGMQADVEVKRISFVDPDDISAEIGSGDHFAASLRLAEPPYGVFLMTFAATTGMQIADQLTAGTAEETFTDLHQSALEEICNITASGFIDGIANALNTTIDIETPTLHRGTGDDIASITLTHVRTDALAIVLDAAVTLEDSERPISLFLIPDPGSFVNLIDGLDR